MRVSWMEESAEDFVTDMLGLYHGPTVKLKLGSGGTEYTVAKRLLSKQSPYFSVMFDGTFKEARQRTVVLEEVPGVLSPQSFQLFLPWLYKGKVFLPRQKTPEEHITLLIELARLADMYDIATLGAYTARLIKSIMKNSPDPRDTDTFRHPDTNTHCITYKHIAAAARLPRGHAVRVTLASASVEGFILHDQHRLLKETREIPEYAQDLLQELKAPLREMGDIRCLRFRDPFSGRISCPAGHGAYLRSHIHPENP